MSRSVGASIRICNRPMSCPTSIHSQRILAQLLLRPRHNRQHRLSNINRLLRLLSGQLMTPPRNRRLLKAVQCRHNRQIGLHLRCSNVRSRWTLMLLMRGSRSRERIYSGSLRVCVRVISLGRFLGSESSILRPVRWKRHTTLLKVSEYPLLSSEVEPILNIISGGRIIPKQVDGRGSSVFSVSSKTVCQVFGSVIILPKARTLPSRHGLRRRVVRKCQSTVMQSVIGVGMPLLAAAARCVWFLLR